MCGTLAAVEVAESLFVRPVAASMAWGPRVLADLDLLFDATKTSRELTRAQ